MKNVHVLPTDKDSNLFIGDLSNQLHFNYSIEKGNSINQNIYITSDEEITGFEINIWVIKGDRIFLWQNTMALVSNNKPKKIILTTDQDLIKDGVQAIDDEFLEWFVNNPSCEEVEIQCRYNFYAGQDLTHYKIIIPSSEIWKDIPEFEGYYQISNLGNVKSLSRTILGRGKHDTLLKERLLKFSTSTNGYYQVILQKEGFKKIYKVHSLVAICFLNHTPDGTHNVVIDHINEIKTDNKLENLRLIGHRENVSRSMKHLIDMMKRDEELGLYEEPKQDLEKEMFELEQQLDIPSSIRWYNSKPKQETTSLEEAAEIDLTNLCYYDKRNPDCSVDDEDIEGYKKSLLKKNKTCSCDNCFYGRTELTEQLIRQAERMYSEEEVKEIIEATLIEYSDFVLADIPEWFEQFKKK